MNRGTMSVRVNPLRGNGIDTYCKLTQYEYAEGRNNKYTFSFGTGPRRYCMIVSIDGKDYSSAYIDRIDRLEKCTKGVTITDVADGMAKFVSLGLYAIRKMCPYLTRFTLKDDSKVICQGVKGPSIGLAYDSLLKYNMTWYQKRFGARLDGFMEEEKGDDIETFSFSPGPRVFHAVKGSLMYQFLKSLEVLDEPCREFMLLRDHFPELDAYRDLYEASSSPRDFISRVRTRFSDPASFCHGVARWFDRYMNSLRIQLFMDSWFIPVEQIQEPRAFAVDKAVEESVLNSYRGGKRVTRRNRQGRTPRRGRVQGIVGGSHEEIGGFLKGSVVESYASR